MNFCTVCRCYFTTSGSCNCFATAPRTQPLPVTYVPYPYFIIPNWVPIAPYGGVSWTLTTTPDYPNGTTVTYYNGHTATPTIVGLTHD